MAMAWVLGLFGCVRKVGAFALVFSWVIVSQVSAQSCQMPSKLSHLSDVLVSYLEFEGPISAQRALQLGQIVDNIDDQHLVVQLRENGLQSLSMVVADLISEAERIATAAEIQDSRRLKGMLHNLNQQALIACADSDGKIFQNIQQERDGGIIEAGKVDWEAVNRVLAKDRSLSMAILVVLVGIVIGVLYLADTSYRLAMAMLYNRKACRIPVTLRLGMDRIPVFVTTLGRGGCRITPEEPVMFDTHLAKLRQTTTVFDFEGKLIEAQVSAIYEDVSDFRFEYRIPLRLQKELLSLSTISPFYVKKNRRKPRSKPETAS
ncbi:hypothetical protein [uncultured Pelagimonas sp.]|uniref:hypothetical protein n=1 Tax=uncultured Pelagimonas sp. TaxID=1618102 RepID=UPI00262E2C4E|nr:hypothetical protein [uncultured Pelagimonas sp.]